MTARDYAIHIVCRVVVLVPFWVVYLSALA